MYTDNESGKGNNRKLTAKCIIIASCFLAIIAFIVFEFIHQTRIEEEKVKRHEYLNQLRNMETDELQEGFTNVYVDIVSFTPWYEVYNRETLTVSNGYVSKCETVNGNIVWVYAPKTENRLIIPYSGKRTGAYTYPANDPLRLNGTLVKIKDIGEGSHPGIEDDDLILKVDKYPVAYNDREERQEYLNIARNMDDDEVEDGFKNVYADIVSIEPWVYLSDSQIGLVSEEIFKCKTVKGKTIWVHIHVGGATKEYAEEHYPAHTYPSNNPQQIHGKIITAKSLSPDLARDINYSTMVLSIDEYPE